MKQTLREADFMSHCDCPLSRAVKRVVSGFPHVGCTWIKVFDSQEEQHRFETRYSKRDPEQPLVGCLNFSVDPPFDAYAFDDLEYRASKGEKFTHYIDLIPVKK